LVNLKPWKKTTIGAQVTLQRGIDITKAEQRHGSVPVISSGGVSSYHDQAAVNGPGVILGRKGVVGSVYYCPVDYWPHDTTLWVKDFHGNEPRFVYYFFKNYAPELARLDVGSANPTLNRNHVHPKKTLWPPLSEQHAIARVLSSLDDKVELNRRMNTTLEAMAQAIFKSWFVDFDPVRAKMEGREPAGMDAETAALFPDGFERMDGQEVPEGWKIGSLTTVVEVLGGGTPKTTVDEYWDGQIPWFSVVDAPNLSDVFVIDTEKKITEFGLNNSSAQILPVGTTIITARGTVGKIALVAVPMAMNQSCYGLSGKDGYGPFFTYFLTRDAVSILKQNTHGSVFDTITRQTLNDAHVIIPTKGACGAFEKQVEHLLKRIESNLFESRTLAALRDTLLPKLISGEVRVSSELKKSK